MVSSRNILIFRWSGLEDSSLPYSSFLSLLSCCISVLSGFGVQAAWRLSAWDWLDRFLTSFRSPVASTDREQLTFDVSVGTILSALHRKNDWVCYQHFIIPPHFADCFPLLLGFSLNAFVVQAAQRAILTAREEVLQPLYAASLDSYSRAYPYLVQLQMLAELEEASQPILGLVNQRAALREMMDRWQARFQRTQPSFKTRDPILALRRVLYDEVRSLSCSFHQFDIDLLLIAATSLQMKRPLEVGQCWIQLSKLSRASGQYDIAFSAVLRAMQLNALSGRIEYAKLIHDRVCHHSFCFLRFLFLCHLFDCSLCRVKPRALSLWSKKIFVLLPRLQLAVLVLDLFPLLEALFLGPDFPCLLLCWMPNGSFSVQNGRWNARWRIQSMYWKICRTCDLSSIRMMNPCRLSPPFTILMSFTFCVSIGPCATHDKAFFQMAKIFQISFEKNRSKIAESGEKVQELVDLEPQRKDRALYLALIELRHWGVALVWSRRMKNVLCSCDFDVLLLSLVSATQWSLCFPSLASHVDSVLLAQWKCPFPSSSSRSRKYNVFELDPPRFPSYYLFSPLVSARVQSRHRSGSSSNEAEAKSAIQNLEEIREFMNALVVELPTYLLLTSLPQVISRIGHPSPEVLDFWSFSFARCVCHRLPRVAFCCTFFLSLSRLLVSGRQSVPCSGCVALLFAFSSSQSFRSIKVCFHLLLPSVSLHWSCFFLLWLSAQVILDAVKTTALHDVPFVDLTLELNKHLVAVCNKVVFRCFCRFSFRCLLLCLILCSLILILFIRRNCPVQPGRFIFILLGPNFPPFWILSWVSNFRICSFRFKPLLHPLCLQLAPRIGIRFLVWLHDITCFALHLPLDTSVLFDFCVSGGQISIVRISDEVDVLKSKERPRRLSILASDGVLYWFLMKKEEKGDLRKDSRLMDICNVVNRLFTKDPEARRRGLRLRTFAVSPLTENTAIIEWVCPVVTGYDGVVCDCCLYRCCFVLLGPSNRCFSESCWPTQRRCWYVYIICCRHPVLLLFVSLLHWPGRQLAYSDIMTKFYHDDAGQPMKFLTIEPFQRLLAYAPPILHKWFLDRFPEPTL